ncbi:MAG TPA: aldo/keto reductase [Sporichthyaceae bacterium]|nr:aldo/keto reductase [Sporichthyaceae bacterium]
MGLGTGTWGIETDAVDAGELLAAFAAAGGTLLDTGPHYTDGRAEEMLGSLLGKAFRRDDFVLATKAGVTLRSGGLIADSSRRALLDSLDASLARLDTDHVDLWQIQLLDPMTPPEETLSALEHAVASGRARYVGVANHSGWQLARASTLAECAAGHARIVAAGTEYSLLERSAEAEMLPAAAALGVGVLAYAPLGGGVLTGKYRHNTPLDSRAARTDLVEHHLTAPGRRVVDAVTMAAEGLGVSPAEVALAWVRDRAEVASVIVGARTVAQLAPSLAAEALVLPTEIRRALADVSGGGSA